MPIETLLDSAQADDNNDTDDDKANSPQTTVFDKREADIRGSWRDRDAALIRGQLGLPSPLFGNLKVHQHDHELGGRDHVGNSEPDGIRCGAIDSGNHRRHLGGGLILERELDRDRSLHSVGLEILETAECRPSALADELLYLRGV